MGKLNLMQRGTGKSTLCVTKSVTEDCPILSLNFLIDSHYNRLAKEIFGKDAPSVKTVTLADDLSSYDKIIVDEALVVLLHSLRMNNNFEGKIILMTATDE